jgi:hypothetical protein
MENNQVEVFLKDNIFNANFRPPSLDEEEILKACLSLDKAGKEIGLLEKIDEKHIPVEFTTIEKMLKSNRFSITMSIALKHFICLIGKTPGVILMYLGSMQFYAKHKNIKHLITKDICYAFSAGFPTDDSFKKAWANQKIGSEKINLLDSGIAYTSIK